MSVMMAVNEATQERRSRARAREMLMVHTNLVIPSRA